MARFDPHAYPNRQAFHALARQLRADELGRVGEQLRNWLARLRHEAGHLAAHPATVSRQHPHR
jgi:hypothetical protein